METMENHSKSVANTAPTQALELELGLVPWCGKCGKNTPNTQNHS